MVLGIGTEATSGEVVIDLDEGGRYIIESRSTEPPISYKLQGEGAGLGYINAYDIRFCLPKDEIQARALFQKKTAITKKSPDFRAPTPPDELPYPTAALYSFEAWVNELYAEVQNNRELSYGITIMLVDDAGDPRPGDLIPDEEKREILSLLLREGFVAMKPVPAAGLLPTKVVDGGVTLGLGFHGTARDPDTVIKVHKGTTRYVDIPGEPERRGIDSKWHPLSKKCGYNGEAYFRRGSGDNELNTTVSIARSFEDSTDFPLIQSMIYDPAQHSKIEVQGDRFVTYTFVYLVGVETAFNTNEYQLIGSGGGTFGKGEIATTSIPAHRHYAWVKYKREHFGPTREHGHCYEAVDSGLLLPGSAPPELRRAVEETLKKMRGKGVRKGIHPSEPADPALIGRPQAKPTGPVGLSENDVRGLLMSVEIMATAARTQPAVFNSLVDECQKYTVDIATWARAAGVYAPPNRFFLQREIVKLFHGVPSVVDAALVKHVHDRRTDPATRLRIMAMFSPGPVSRKVVAGWLKENASLSELARNNSVLFGMIADELYLQGKRVAVWARDAGLVDRALSENEALLLIAVAFREYTGATDRAFLDYLLRVGPSQETRKKVQDVLRKALSSKQ